MSNHETIKPVRIGIVGCGYFGLKVARSFRKVPEMALTAVCDGNEAALRKAVEDVPGVIGFTSLPAMLDSSDVDAVVVATPPASHAALASACLHAGKHVLVEKPLTTSSSDAESLTAFADSHRLVLMVDHTPLFTPAADTMFSLVRSGRIGRPRHIHCERSNFGAFRADVNAAWDLAPHDLAFVLHLAGSPPSQVNATGFHHTSAALEDVVQLSLVFPDGLTASIHSSRVSPVKVRRCMVAGETGSLFHEESGDQAVVRLCTEGIGRDRGWGNNGRFSPLTIRHKMQGPDSALPDPLATVGAHFVDCVRKGSRPVSDGGSGLAVVRVLEACDRSLARAGGAVFPAHPHPESLPRPA